MPAKHAKEREKGYYMPAAEEPVAAEEGEEYGKGEAGRLRPAGYTAPLDRELRGQAASGPRGGHPERNAGVVP